MLAEIHRDGEVIDQRMAGDLLLVEARIDDVLAGRLRNAGAEVSKGKVAAAAKVADSLD
jgi:GTPase